MKIHMALISALLATGCAAGGTPAAGPTTTVTATVTDTATVTVTATPSPASDPLEGLFEEGFPEVISVDKMPDYMQSSVDGDRVVAIAPGLYTEFIDGIDPVDLAIDGSPFGLCAALAKWERALTNAGYDTRGSTCW